jgi:hypothetical protein
MRKNPGDTVTAEEIRSLPLRGWAVSGVLLQTQVEHAVGRLGDLTEAEASALRDVLATRIADGSIKVTFLEVWDRCHVFRVHHISGEVMKGTFDVEGVS